METAASTESGSSDTPNSPEESGASVFRVHLIAGHNIWEWVFLLVATWNVALLLASSGVALAQCEIQRSIMNPEFTSEIVVIVTAVVALAFATYGVHNEHQFDMCLHMVFISIADFFAFLAADKECHACFKRACFFIGCLMTGVNCFMVHKATHAVDWTEFRIAGASDSLNGMYKRQCAFLSLLKFDSIFVVICAFYSFPITLDFPNIRNLYLLFTLIIMYSFMCWCCGKITVCREDKYLASGFVVLSFTYPFLIAYQIYMSKTHVNNFRDPLFFMTAQYIGVIIIITKVALTVWMIQIVRTFGYGLNSNSFHALVARDSSSLFAYTRSSILY